jgi:prepilin-type N-terminal cleavage/methylation domain-containing protein
MIRCTYRVRLDKNLPRNAFTLLELLTVVAILFILAGGAIFYVFGYQEEAKNDKAKLQAKAIEAAAKSYHHKHKELPPNPTALIHPDNGEKPLLEGGKEAIVTPWGGHFTLREDQDSHKKLAIMVRWVDGDGKQHDQLENSSN